MFERKAFLITLAIAVIAAMVFPACASQPAITPVAITVVGADGTSEVVDLAQMTAMTGDGGYIKTTLTVRGPFSYKGVEINELLDLVGGITEEQSVRVTATDGYTLIFTYDQINGNVMTYDGYGKLLGIEDLTMLIAYESDGEEGFEGSPRIVFIGEGPPITLGPCWVKDVATIEVVPAVAEWQLTVSGYETLTIDRSTYEDFLASCHSATCVYHDHTYEGVPLYILVGVVDNSPLEEGHYVYNYALADEGYTVRIISSDGYFADLDSDFVAQNNIILAYQKDGEPLPENEFPLRLLGDDLTSEQRVKQVVEIQLILPQ